jgi:hypothetical protein
MSAVEDAKRKLCEIVCTSMLTDPHPFRFVALEFQRREWSKIEAAFEELKAALPSEVTQE